MRFAGRVWHDRAIQLLTVFLPFLVYGIALHLLLPIRLLAAAVVVPYTFVIPTGVLLWLVYGRSGRLGGTAGLTVTLGLFSLPLLAMWSHVGIHSSAIGGLLPVADASEYYYGARRLLDGHPLGWSGRRSLFVGTLSALLGATGQNLQLVLALFGAIGAVTCFRLGQELRASHNAASAAIVVLLAFFFFRFEGGVGTVLTENLGLPLGMIGFAVLWRGARERRMGVLWFSLGLLTMALMTRPGSFLVLPALVGAGAWSLRGDARWSVRFLAGAVIVIVGAVGVSLALQKVLTDSALSASPFPNFSFTLYGLAVGGKGWEQVFSDHPGAREGAEIYALAWQAFRARPMGIIVGSLAMWRQYLPPHPFHAFAFVPGWLQTACYTLSALGVILCIRRYRQPPYMLLGAALIGHVASIPFVPPIDAGLRVYAATIPILILLVAIAGGELTERVWRLLSGTGSDDPTTTPGAAYGGRYVEREISARVGVGLVALVVAGPLIAYAVGASLRSDSLPCAAETETVYVRVSAGSALRIVEDTSRSADKRVAVPEVRAAHLRRALGFAPGEHEVDRVAPGNAIMNTYDLKAGRNFWLIVPSQLLPAPPSIVRICGHFSVSASAGGLELFFADSVRLANAP